jgi:CheY-like chemotaxis protein
MPKPRILIVEDEGVIAVYIKTTLMSLGYEVLPIAISGRSAIETTERHKPDLVLMDITLSGRMDGIEAANIIMDRFNIPVIYVTAHSDAMVVERAMNTKPAGFLHKPVDESLWDSSIKAALGRS